MKLFYLSSIFLFLVIQVPGQDKVSFPILYQKGFVYLKNGSVLKGRYIYSDSMEKLRLNSGRNTWIFNVSEIDKVTKSRPKSILENDPAISATNLPATNWFNFTELGILTGNSENSQSSPLVFSSSINRKINKNMSAGIGIGAEFLKETYLPVTANFIYRVRDSRFTPYAMLQTGYQVPVEDSRPLYYQVVPDYLVYSSSYIWNNSQSELKAKGGFLINPSFGIMRQTASGFGMCLSFGYRFHLLHYTGEDDYGINIAYNRLSIKLGIIIY